MFNNIKMKERVLRAWTLKRVLHLVLGGFVIIQSIEESQWFMMVLGVYIASMGLFAFGCSAANCFGDSCPAEPKRIVKGNIDDIEFEEIKKK